MKAVQLAVAVAVLALAGSAMAIDVGGALKGAAKKGGQMAVESQINKDLADESCACKDGKVDKQCLTKVAAKLKTEHALAEKNGFADFNIYVDSDEKCAKVTEATMKSLVGWADTTVNSKKDTKTLSFSVKLN